LSEQRRKDEDMKALLRTEPISQSFEAPPLEIRFQFVHSFMQRLLSGGCYSIRLQGGGQAFLNLSNLVGYTVYPGVPEIPNDAWMAISSELSSVPISEANTHNE